ncbi:unnamed protein product [Sphagnum balticum]
MKLIQYQLKQQREQRNTKGIYAGLLIGRVQMMLLERGGVREAFKRAKQAYYGGLERDGHVISTLMERIGQMGEIFDRKRRFHLVRGFYRWRGRVREAVASGDVTLVGMVQASVQRILEAVAEYQWGGVCRY